MFKLLVSEGKFDHIQENLLKLEEKVENLQVSFMNNGNVTMVTMIVGNSQIQRAVDL
jgi:tetrahydromethanopterin S-methyltransferase subunit G